MSTEGPNGALSRRQAALALLASGLGFGLSACGRSDEEEIIPYVEKPERITPGVPLRFATTLPLNGYGRGVLAITYEGRPIKLEGNPEHPASQGATDVFAEAEVLSLYDPDRSRVVRQHGHVASWEAFVTMMLPRLRALEGRKGEGLSILTGNVTSPTLLRLIGSVRRRFSAMRWHVHEPIGEDNANAGARLAFGKALTALPRLDRAAVVLALDADPLGPGPDQIRNGREFLQRRTARRKGGAESFMRLYAVEPLMTQTGAKADHRLALSQARLRDMAIALAARLGAGVQAPDLPEKASRFLDAAVADLRSHPGEALVLTAEWQPPEVHALVHWINGQLRAPVDYIEPILPGADDAPAPLAPLLEDLRGGKVDTLLILGANPAYDAPSTFDVAGALRSTTAMTVHHGLHVDETAVLCRWHLPDSHSLEDWSDLRARDGTTSIVQPLIRPLYATRPAAWLFGLMQGNFDLTARDAVRATWQPKIATENFEDWWRQVLHDGVVAGSAAPRVRPPEPVLPQIALSPGGGQGSLTLALRPDPSVWDGRFANNAWLQECPKPLTKLVWGNAAYLAPEELRARRLRDGDVVHLRLGAHSVEAPVAAQNGMAPGVVALTLGYGRTHAGAIGDNLGANAYAIRRADALWYASGLMVEPTGRRTDLASTARIHKLEGEEHELLPVISLEEFRREAAQPPSPSQPPPSLYPDYEYNSYAWAMVIDSARCIGCNACVIACQAENNVPVVGPGEVIWGRDMHWLRVDVYEHGPESDPRPDFQPVPCMHCEQAPCEPVCPVAASVHDGEGLNAQVYNRCIGTRFCQANCPYKVRRFNFFGYANGEEYRNQGSEILTAQRNPQVTVRGRGVMEKCTYCVQRIAAARKAAEKENRGIREGEVVPACAAACPASAILFGDLNRPGSTASALRKEPQHYALLGELGTRPRTTYLKSVRNANPALGQEELP
ncbi:MAG: 4Fe-4S dicluster domain-containing protein [Acetobacteraceae bacterium]|nr:4Fe-4S dicluster domain-containing protein [Acetobacteraceae bacterium]